MSAWFRQRKTAAVITAVAVVAGVPLTIAVLHKGFPVNAVELDTRDVWVTNGEKLLGGRLNHQIDELDAAVTGASADLDVLQDGSAYFLTDLPHGTVDKIDPAFVSLGGRIQVPEDSQVGYGGTTLSVLAPNGNLWVLDASGRLDFDKSKTKPVVKAGAGAKLAVAKSGTTFVVAPKGKRLITVDGPGAKPQTRDFAVPGAFQVSAVGDQAVVLDTQRNRMITGGGTTVDLPAKGLRLQQPGPDDRAAVVATANSLLSVPLGGGTVTASPAGATSKGGADAVSAPVRLGTCSYGAWSGSGRYLYACDGKKPVGIDIDQPVAGDDLEFRVNHGVIALNNLRDGNAWVVSSNMRLVQNWAQLKPNDTTVQGETGEEKPVVQSFADTLAQRTDQNRPPIAVNDTYGVRPGRSTVLHVLTNDTDPDGDVLTISDVSAIPVDQGVLQLVEGGRAIQFTPKDGLSGTISFRYSVDDGRGGTSSAQVDATLKQPAVNEAPASTRSSTAQTEVGQSVTYNVLNDWTDPDGDDLSLVAASATTEDDVRFKPNGDVTFTSKTGQAGSKEVRVTISDGRASATGSLIVTVKPAGTLDPVAVTDFADGFTGRPVVLHPLDNDQSPSGEPLSLVGAGLDGGSGAQVTADSTRGTITVRSNAPGEYYLVYTLGAGPKTTTGLARVDIAPQGASEAPPIAVTDKAYVRPGEPTSVAVLENDVSPSGRVLAVRSVSVGKGAEDLNVEVLDNAVVKITAPTVLTQQVQLSYVVSDGINEATAGITVVPVPPLVQHQPPVAVDDQVPVRAGDVATVPVMDNDYSPDNAPFTLDTQLRDASGAGQGATAFVSGETVRYQAPTTPGQYNVVYGITDKYGQKAQATVTFVVGAPDKGSDRAPQPQPLTVRAFAGSSVPVEVPLDGIDPDGDSVSLSGLATQPTLGRISDSTSRSFTYQAYPDSAGTDTFTYQVKDTYGKTATGTVSIAVIPRPDQVRPPIAVNDPVQVKPGRTIAVPVLDNDSDPNGYAIALQKKLLQVDEGLKASVHGKIVLVTAPKEEGSFVVRYQITNGQGGVASAFIQVTVTPNAKDVPPTAVDHVLEPDEVANKQSVKVNALQGATNPSGLVDDLKVEVTGPNASAAEVGQDGSITVKPGEQRIAIAYSLTDTVTGLKGTAFIVVPPKGDATAPPRLKDGLPQQIVQADGSKSWKLSDILTVPSGRDYKLTGASGVSATNSSGGSSYGDEQTLTFTAAKGYRGPAAITFKVSDGREAGQSSDRVTTLVLPITVGEPDQSDVAPTFTSPSEKIEPGEAPLSVDLRASSFHPNPEILNKLTYSGGTSSNPKIQSGLSGSTLTLSAPLGVQAGETATIAVTISSGTHTISGTVNVQVVSSSRPVATQKNPPQTAEVKRGQTATVDGASSDAQWVNPFPGQPLTITDATAQSAPAGVTVTHTGSSISVSASSGAAIGAVNVVYHVEDATKDPKRTASAIGQLRVTIHDVPSKPSAPSNPRASDGKVTVSIKAPADNGKPITQYEVTDGNGHTVNTASVGDVTIGGLTNGKSYSFTVRAQNADGWSERSAGSTPVTPYGTPTKVSGVSLQSSGNAPSDLTMSWNALSDPNGTGGGQATYHYRLNGGSWQTTTGTSAKANNKGAGTYSFEIYASNAGGKDGPHATSNSVEVKDPPPPSPSIDLSKGDLKPGFVHSYTYDVTLHNFPANRSFSMQVHCNGGTLSNKSISTDGNGYGHYRGNPGSDLDPWCGYPGAYVVVNGVQSSVQDWSK
ncbi:MULTISPECIES: Ig-like domain-containing protein [unclassified Leifsonia]|uniref:Ig-like domain-containing protein n=1 Tax=unclassified Leifsonia TaxID=2663824 RepID=UPI00039F0193|nr:MULTISPECIES: Ig-like domain-containing protein [unclassified Leifsonia]TDQ03455.1 fibronectin type III domain protein [Leifsonia sp. 115AMFTsu3.1]